MLPDDLIGIMVFADSYNWSSGPCYEEQGFAMFMRAPRWKLRKFYNRAFLEFNEFASIQKLKEKLRERREREEEDDHEDY